MKILYTLVFTDKTTHERVFADKYEGRLWLEGVLTSGLWITLSSNERYFHTKYSIISVRVQEDQC